MRGGGVNKSLVAFGLVLVTTFFSVNCSTSKKETTPPVVVPPITCSNEQVLINNACVAVTQPPNIPTGLTTTYSQDTIVLNWNITEGASSYSIIWRSSQVDSTTEYKTISNITTVTYSHTNLVAGVTYFYRIFAVNRIGASSLTTNWVSLMTLVIPVGHKFTTCGIIATALECNANGAVVGTGNNAPRAGETVTPTTSSYYNTKNFFVSTNGVFLSTQFDGSKYYITCEWVGGISRTSAGDEVAISTVTFVRAWQESSGAVSFNNISNTVAENCALFARITNSDRSRAKLSNKLVKTGTLAEAGITLPATD